MGFDLTKNNFAEKAELGYEFEVIIPEVQEKTGAFITVRGAESPKVKNYGRRKFNEMQFKEHTAKKKGKDLDPITLDEAEDMAIEAALVRIISWKGFEEGGKKLEFTEENARRVLREHAWIREQVLSESNQLSNFI
jgi:hypothetical protein